MKKDSLLRLISTALITNIVVNTCGVEVYALILEPTDSNIEIVSHDTSYTEDVPLVETKEQESDDSNKINNKIDGEVDEISNSIKEDEPAAVEESDMKKDSNKNNIHAKDMKAIVFKDTNLEAAVRAQLKIESSSPITEDLMKTLTRLSANNKNISDLSGLEFATNLQYLYLENNSISDIDVINKLSNLEEVFLNNNNISTITSLNSLSNLYILEVQENNLTDLMWASELVSLEELNVADNKLTSVSGLGSLKGLYYLDISNNNITNIDSLNLNTSMSSLLMDNNSVSDLSKLSSLKNLRNIAFSGNNVENIDVLASLSGLKIVAAKDNLIHDISKIKNKVFTDLAITENLIDSSNGEYKTYLKSYSKHPNNIRQYRMVFDTQSNAKTNQHTISVKKVLTDYDGFEEEQSFDINDIVVSSEDANVSVVEKNDGSKEIIIESSTGKAFEVELSYKGIKSEASSTVISIDGSGGEGGDGGDGGDGGVTDGVISDNWLTQEVSKQLSKAVDDLKKDDFTLITDINLQGKSLSGDMPKEIAYLTNLVSLNLSQNNLSGGLPSEMKQMTKLQRLDLSGNGFTGELNNFIGDFKELELLHLQGNNFTGGINGNVLTLFNLKSLDLSNNNLNGEIPSQLYDLTNLEHLALAFNGLSGSISPNVKQLVSLEHMNLEGNSLSGIIPTEIGLLGAIDYLDISKNQFTGEIPKEIGNLANIRVLNICRNQLTGFIPSEIGSLTKLRHVYLNENKLSGEIPSAIGNLSILVELFAYGNNLSGEIPTELGNLQQLQKLWLGGNPSLTGTIPKELGSIAPLQSLWIEGCNLSGSIPKELFGLPNLEDLMLYNNNLTGAIPVEVTNSPSLKVLNIKNNNLHGKLPQALSLNIDTEDRYDAVYYTDFSGNQFIGKLPENLSNIASPERFMHNIFEDGVNQKQLTLLNTTKLDVKVEDVLEDSILRDSVSLKWTSVEGLEQTESVAIAYNLSLLADREDFLDNNTIIAEGSSTVRVKISEASMDNTFAISDNSVIVESEFDELDRYKKMYISFDQGKILNELNNVEYVSKKGTYKIVDSKNEKGFVSNGDFFEVPFGDLNLSGKRDFTVSFSFRWGGQNNIFPFTTDIVGLWINNNRIGLNIGDEMMYGVPITFNVGEEVHISVALDSKNLRNSKMYINGVLQDIQDLGANPLPPSVSDSIGKTILLGGYESGAGDYTPIDDTMIDEIQVYQKKITDSEAEEISKGDGESDGDDNVVAIVPDDNLREVIRLKLNKPTGDILVSDLKGMTGTLNAFGRDIISLEGLQYCTNLTNINLIANRVTDLSPIQNLKKLSVLNLGANNVQDLSPLQTMTGLEEIFLDNNPFSDIKPLAKLSRLVRLDMTDCKVTDLTPLSNIVSLKHLTMRRSSVSDINFLSSLINLESLDLSFNSIRDISALANLGNLQVLVVESNKISDISALRGLTKLKILTLESNMVYDISVLDGYYPNLARVQLSKNYIDAKPDSHARPIIAKIRKSGCYVGFAEESRYQYALKLKNTPSGDLEVNDVFVPQLEIFSTQDGVTQYASTTPVLNTDVEYEIENTGVIGISSAGNSNNLLAKSYGSSNVTIKYKGMGGGASIGINLNVAGGPVAHIPDAAVESLLREATGKLTGDLTQYDLSKITGVLDGESRDIVSLEGFQYCTNVTKLVLSGNQISDLSPLANMPNLEEIALYGNNVVDLSPLSQLTGLRSLQLSANQISDISPLAGLTELVELHVSSNNIDDVSTLSGLTKLKILYLRANKLQDISPLSSLVNLHTLYLSENKIADVSPLASMKDMELLYLSSNNISNIDSLRDMIKMNTLYLSYNKISDISVIGNMSNLETLYAPGNLIYDIAMLQSLHKLKNLVIDSNYIDAKSGSLSRGIVDAVKSRGGTVRFAEGSYTQMMLKNLDSSNVTLQRWRTYSPKLQIVKTQDGVNTIEVVTNVPVADIVYSISDPNIVAVTSDNILSTRSTVGSTDVVFKYKGLGGASSVTMNLNVVEIVAFSDVNMERAVRLALNKPVGDIHVKDMLTLTSLDASGFGIQSLSGLEYAKNLKRLDLSNNKIQDISILSSLTSLSTLNISYNNISNIKALESMKNLKEINLANNNVEDLSPLLTLGNLQLIYVKNNPLDLNNKGTVNVLDRFYLSSGDSVNPGDNIEDNNSQDNVNNVDDIEDKIEIDSNIESSKDSSSQKDESLGKEEVSDLSSDISGLSKSLVSILGITLAGCVAFIYKKRKKK